MCRIIRATDASGTMNLKNYKEWLDAVESVPKSTRASDVAVALTPVPGIEFVKKLQVLDGP